MSNLTDINIWKQGFGLLPIHLRPNESKSDFVMLNGGYGDFCLQTINEESEINYYFSQAWSSNTKNFIVLANEKLKIYNWTKDSPEEIPTKTVQENFNKFYNYLLSKSYKSYNDVVPFIIDIFRQFRNITFEKSNPVEALNLLFILLASLEDDIHHMNWNKWNIGATKLPQGFDYYIEKIHTGIGIIKPQIELIIRHSAGILFQEAQKEVLFFNPQLDLFGGISNKLETTNKQYSSIHYTPPYIARTIVENTLSQLKLNEMPELKIFDPACGSSEFLIEALKQLRERDYKGNIEIIGWDSSETAVITSQFLLKFEQQKIWNENLKFQIKLVEDSLTENWENDYDIILMNPPFVSWELLINKKSKEAIKETLQDNFIGKPNQASAFFYKSILHLSDNGVIGCVIPSSLLTLDSYSKLRNSIFEIISFGLIGKLGNFIFEDALTDVSLIIGSKPKTNRVPIILWTQNEKGIAQNALRDLRKMNSTNSYTIDNKEYSVFHPVSFPLIKESWKTISYRENEFIKTIERFNIEKRLKRIEDIFSVKQGIRQGAKDIFKVSTQFYGSLPKNEQKFFRPVVDNEAIKNGVLLLKNYIWYPYDENGIILKSEQDLQNQANFVFTNILSPNEEILKNRAGISEWWTHTRPRNWQYERIPKLISTEFGKSDSFSFDIKGDFVVERGHAWVPKKDFEESDFFFYNAILSSPFFDKLLSIYSKQLAGGKWYDLGKKYTSQIPIPDVNSLNIRESDAYFKLVEIGKEMLNGNAYARNISAEILTKTFYPEL